MHGKSYIPDVSYSNEEVKQFHLSVGIGELKWKLYYKGNFNVVKCYIQCLALGTHGKRIYIMPFLFPLNLLERFIILGGQ